LSRNKPRVLKIVLIKKISVAGITGMNMSVEINMLRLLCQTISVRPVP